MHYFRQTSILFLILVTLGCDKGNFKNKKVRWPQIDLSLKTLLVIGTDSTTFLSHPKGVVTDSKGRIIIADAGRKKLLAFNRKGKLLYTIGKKGPGPDEFRNIEGMTIDSNDVITVFDRSSQALKRFNASGNYINSVILDKPLNSGLEFDRWNSHHLLYYIDYNRGAGKNYFFHIYSADYHLIESKIPIQSLEDLNQNLLSLFTGDTGSHFIDGNRLYYAPLIYSGIIYKYSLAQRKQGLELSLKNTYHGLVNMNIPAQRFDGLNLSYADANETIPGGIHYQYLVHNESKGLFQLKNGNIVHFTVIESKHPHKRVFGVELYNHDMNPIGYSPIKTLLYDKNNTSNLLSWNVVWKDKKDRFYILDTQHISKVRVVKLQMGEEVRKQL